MAVDYDQILAKRPNSSDSIFAWHQDMAYWPPLTSSTATGTCWLAVSDSSVENGCMRFVPGSHKEPELRRHWPGGAHTAVCCLGC
jgi:phytanoyl-CoA hydroxylase